MIRICSFASGSGGNCIYVATETSSVIIDAGICLKRIKEGLKSVGDGGCPSVLITHTHWDHVAHLAKVAAAFEPDVYVHYSAFGEVKKILGDYRKIFPFDGDFYVGDITVSPFLLSHDVPCVGYSLIHQGKKASVLTDTGIVTEENLESVAGSGAVFIESNHDERLLIDNPRYAYALKRRIMSDKGHLSNAACAVAAVRCIKNGTKVIALCHLSKENNTPSLAQSTVREAFLRAGLDAKLLVAAQDQMSEVIEI